MNNTVQIQLISPQVGVLDVLPSAEVPFTFSISDIRDITQKKGTVSKTIKLDGTKNNNILLNNYFNVNIQDGTFDVNKLQKCRVIQNGLTILDDASLQLISISKTQNNILGEELVEYDILVKDNVADLFTKINNLELTDLEFGVFDHTFTAENVISTFSNTYEDGYKYFIPYQQSSNVYSLQQMKPAIFAKTYFDKIIDGAGFIYEWETFSADTVQFDKALILYNSDQLTISPAELNLLTVVGVKSATTSYSTSNFIGYDYENNDVNGVFIPSTGQYTNLYYLDNNNVINFEFEVNFEVVLNNISGNIAYMSNINGVEPTTGIKYLPKINLIETSPSITTIGSSSLNTTETEFSRIYGSTLPTGQTIIGGGTRNFTITLNNGLPNNLYRSVILLDSDQLASIGGALWATSPGGSGPASVQYIVRISSIVLRIKPSLNSIGYNSTMRMNQVVPNKVKQSDFIKSILTMYNLYVISDPFEPNKLIFKHRDQFYDEGVEVDWSSKLAKNYTQTLTPLSEITAKKLIMTYKQDNNDIMLKGYLDSVKEIYGQIEYTYDSEYVKNIDTKELIFSPITVGKNNFGNVLPFIDGYAPKNNIKIALNAGQYTSDEGITILNYSASSLSGTSSVTDEIPLIHHFDTATNPSFDLNFGTNDFYFYDSFGVKTNNNLFNLHWRRTIDQINHGKMLTAYFNLNEVDINQLQLNQKIFVNNAWWNIVTLTDYKAGKKDLTKVELISVDDSLKFIPFITNDVYSDGGIASLFPIQSFNLESNNSSNLNYSPSPATINGKKNFIGGSTENINITGDNNMLNGGRNSMVIGSNNTLLSSGIIFGDNNTIPESLKNIVIIGNGISASTDNTIYATNIELTTNGTINGLTTQILSGATLWSAGTGSNSIQANNSTGTLASGQYALAIGDNNVAGGYAAVAEGRANNATGNLSHAAGYFTNTNNYNEWGRGHLIATGPSITGQYGFLNFVERTTNATPTEIFLDSTSQRMSIISGSVYSVNMTVVAQDSLGNTSVWTWFGVIKNVSGTTAFVGTPMYTTIAQDLSMITTTIVISADNTNDSLKVEVTGLAATTINWTATAQYTAIKTN